jgi:hypothetical protein
MMRRRPIARMAVRTTVVAGTAAAVGAHAANRRAGEQEAPAQQAAPPPPPPEAAAATPDPIQQLTQLAALRDSGALTEAEFETQKARILG